MDELADIFSSKRQSKRLTLKKAARDLLIKVEILQAIESGKWYELPEPPFAKGLVKNYAQYLGLDVDHMLALYRREFDEAKYPSKELPLNTRKKLMITPNKIINLALFFLILSFIVYLVIEYLSITKSPRLEVFSPPDDITTALGVIEISGKTEKEATVSIDGNFVHLDQDGSFSSQLTLNEGQNFIEIIASKRLSPKAKIKRTIRFSH